MTTLYIVWLLVVAMVMACILGPAGIAFVHFASMI